MVEIEKTEFEKEFKIDLSSRNLDVKKGIEIAIEIEKRGRNFYLSKAKSFKDPQISSFFEFLAGEERRHRQLLEDVKFHLKAMKSWIQIEEKSEINEIANQLKVFKKSAKEIPEYTNDVVIILEAIEIEKHTAEFYEKFAENIDDLKGREFLKKLAEWEKTHLEMLNGIYDSFMYVRSES